MQGNVLVGSGMTILAVKGQESMAPGRNRSAPRGTLQGDLWNICMGLRSTCPAERHQVSASETKAQPPWCCSSGCSLLTLCWSLHFTKSTSAVHPLHFQSLSLTGGCLPPPQTCYSLNQTLWSGGKYPWGNIPWCSTSNVFEPACQGTVENQDLKLWRGKDEDLTSSLKQTLPEPKE